MKQLMKKVLNASIKSSLRTPILMGMVAMTSVSAQASLNVQERAGTAKMSWNGEQGLNNAKAIMYNNTSTVQPIYNNYNPATNTYNLNNYASNNASGFNNASTFNEEGDEASWSIPNTPSYSYNPGRGTNGYYAGSKGAMVMDAQTGQVLYEKNADVARPIASLSKLMTAVIVAESGANMNELITISPADFRTPKKSGSDRLRVGDQMTREEVFLLMLMKSENPAAKALARTDPQGYESFIARMNTKARELGMTQTRYYDPSGLDNRNVASPRDLAILAKYAVRHNVISRFSTTPSREFYINNVNSGSRSLSAHSTNYMVRDGKYNLILSKTGYISEAGKCLIVETNVHNRPAVVVLLGATDSKTRWGDAEGILTTLSNRI